MRTSNFDASSSTVVVSTHLSDQRQSLSVFPRHARLNPQVCRARKAFRPVNDQCSCLVPSHAGHAYASNRARSPAYSGDITTNVVRYWGKANDASLVAPTTLLQSIRVCSRELRALSGSSCALAQTYVQIHLKLQTDKVAMSMTCMQDMEPSSKTNS